MRIAVDAQTTDTVNDCFICMRHRNGQKIPGALCEILRQIPPSGPRTPISTDVCDVESGLKKTTDTSSESLVHACNGHVHTDCIREWVETNSSCPMCRSSVVMTDDMAADSATDPTADSATYPAADITTDSATDPTADSATDPATDPTADSALSRVVRKKKRHRILREEEVANVACVMAILLCLLLSVLILSVMVIFFILRASQ